MQVAAALDTMPDTPCWSDVLEVKRQTHGFGDKTMVKMRELWRTGRLRRVEAFDDNPELVAAKLIVSVHGTGQKRA